MEQTKSVEFLSRRLKELREKNGYTLEEMAVRIGADEGGIAPNKSSLSRAEAGKTTDKTLIEMAYKYCRALKMTDDETEQFLRGKRIAVPDASALVLNPQLIDQLNDEYSAVIFPSVVIDELTKIKNNPYGKYPDSISVKAWAVLNSIKNGINIIRKEPQGEVPDPENHDAIIIQIAREASAEYHCQIDIITNDTDFSAYLKGDKDVMALHLKEYMANHFEPVNMDRLIRIDQYYADDYTNAEEPDENEIRAYLPDGNTLLISCVRRSDKQLEQRKAKIKWLISIDERYHGEAIKAKEIPPLVDLRDRKDKYFPALTHAIQMLASEKNKYQSEIFYFLLDVCKANPNIASRNPFSTQKLLQRQKNEGNTPLMVAAWHGKEEFIRKLCKHPDISINQQDANGFTALIKACKRGFARCRDILINEGHADTRILDLDGKNYEDHYEEFLQRRQEAALQTRNNGFVRNRRP